jgi:hypothetical protein
MSGRPAIFEEFLGDVEADPIVVRTSPGRINEEANGNLWNFGLQDEEASATDVEGVLAFWGELVAARERSLQTQHPGHRMYFYTWFDAMIPALRHSLVSTTHGRLPFGKAALHENGERPYDEAPTLRPIIDAFLAVHYHAGLPLEEFAPWDGSGAPEPPSVKALVWSTLLPR